MNRHEDDLLNRAVDELRNAKPDQEDFATSASRVAGRLGIAMDTRADLRQIESCDDVRRLFIAYRDGSLSEARSLLVKAHLHDCGDCLRRFRSEGDAAVDWSAPKAAAVHARPSASAAWPARRLGWSLAFAGALAICLTFVYRAYWQVPPGVRAEVQSIDGAAFVISDTSQRTLSAGAELHEGDRLRTDGGSRAVIKLADGSTVEMNERSELAVGARGRSMTVALNGGAVIVQAAKRTSGHLYVKTPDCRVAVTGTVFSVDSGIKGSRVAVLKGAVQVMHSGEDTTLQAGDQLATNDNLRPEPLDQQIAWSQNRDQYIALVAQLAALQHRIEKIPFPGSRYTSDLLDRVPAQTHFYLSVPNLGEFLSQANTIFHDQLSQSPELQQWWDHAHKGNTADLDALVSKLHDVSQYLGDEVVLVGFSEGDRPAFAVLADVRRSGLDSMLKAELASIPQAKFTVLDENSLAAMSVSAKDERGGYALVRPHEVVFSGSVAALRLMNERLNAGSSGFAQSQFGRQITAAYGRGAGIILAADLHQMMTEAQAHPRRDRSSDNDFQSGGHKSGRYLVAGNKELEASGLNGVQYLIAEHRETNGAPENHLNLEFSGTRQRVASWLAAPAPIGSLDFVSPNAALVAAGLTKDPKEIADDIIAMAAEKGHAIEGQNAEEEQLESSIRNNLIANLGGDFLVSLDGPVLPTPSWKVVIEVRDPGRIEDTLEQLTQVVDEHQNGKDAHEIRIESATANGQKFYAVKDLTAGNVIAQYTFVDGFMIIAPNRALLMQALETHANGNSLARSAAFKALLPKDDSENCSAVAYQNLSPVLTPLLSQVGSASADTIRKLAADSKPTAVCAWGREDRIEAASDSRLFGFDFLTLGTLLDSRNKLAQRHVTE